MVCTGVAVVPRRPAGDDGYVSAPVPPPEPPPGSDAPSGRVRSGRGPRDIALSLAVLLVPIFLLLLVYRLVFSGDAPVPGDTAGTWDAARHSAHFTVLEPAGLPAKWTAVSAVYQDGTLRVGYVTPDGAGVQLIESDQSADRLLPTELGTDARPGDLVTIGERQWRTYPVARDGNSRALVLVDDGRTVVLVGVATDNDLRTFATSLR
jgi:hypothetical protein